MGNSIRNLPLFLVQDTGVPNRTVNHWESWGLLQFDREDNSKWRRFSLHDLIWVKMVNRFRQMGTSVELILKVNEAIMKPYSIQSILDAYLADPELAQVVKDDSLKHASLEDQGKILEFHQNPIIKPGFEDFNLTLLQQLIIETLTKRVPVSVALFLDGTVFPLVNFKPFPMDDEFLHKMAYEEYMAVSVTGIVAEFLTQKRSMAHLPKLNILTPNEVKLLKIVQSGEYKSVKVNFKGRKMKGFELEKEQDVNKRLVDVLLEGNYQEIIIKQHGGKVASFSNIQKIKLD
ncbi:MAG: MerR family transcriptional regulator [Bacteroidia bacterium]|nr:MerR family transcriptional regulator [Bacteroidia bacterium]